MAKGIPKLTTRDMYHRFCEGDPPDTPKGPMYDKLRSCMSKRTHLTQSDADKAASLQRDAEYVGYKCRWCRMYHIGHKKNVDTLSTPR